MKHLISIGLIILNNLVSFSQNDTNSVYKNLKIHKDYRVSLSALIGAYKATYKVNDKIVDKAIYDKYKALSDAPCCPCILREYDLNEVLLREVVSCGDCGVGEVKVFFPSGNVKVKGKFKENPTSNWEDIYKRGYCNVKDGNFFYYSENKGLHYLSYVEKWKDGIFIEQIPERKKIEIWRVELMLHETKVDSQTLTLNEVRDLKFQFKYKNKLRSNSLKASNSRY
jgi:hypothetical protein